MKRGSILLAIIFTLIIPALIAWPAIRIAGYWTAGQESARTSYGTLRRLAVDSLKFPSAVATSEWMDTAQKTWIDDDRILAIVVSDSTGNVLYALPKSSPYYADRGPETKSPAFVHPENTVARFNGAISSGLVLDALYITLRQGELYKPLKDATISLLALLAFTASWLLVASSTNQAKTLHVGETGPEAAQIFETRRQDTEPALPEESDVPEYPDQATSDYLSEIPELIELPTPQSASSRTTQATNTIIAELPREFEHAAVIKPQTENLDSVESLTSTLNGPRGLYDPETGLGWESYLRERLGAELRRSASFEQDLSILIATLDSATGRTDPKYAVFAKTSRNFFSFNDLAFLFGTKGLVVIIPNTDIDQAMRMSEELLKKLVLLIQDRSNPMSYLNLYMGLSSRAGRLVEADRLIGEAMAAHRKAREEQDTHIMAFRPDPEKYRAYLANK